MLFRKKISFTLRVAAVVMATMLTTSCGDRSSFQVSGVVEGLGTQNLHIVYYDGRSVVNRIAVAVDSKFVFEGNAPTPTLIEVYSNMNVPMGRFVAKNGDEIDLKLRQNDKRYMEVSGNKTSARLAAFLAGNHDADNLNKAIEAYVGSHADDAVAGVLMTAYYDWSADPAAADSLLQLIPAESIPSGAIECLSASLSRANMPVIEIGNLQLVTDTDSLAIAKVASERLTLFHFDDERAPSSQTQDAMKGILTRKDLKVINIRMTPDTAGWSKTKEAYPTATRFLARRSIAEPSLAPLNIPQLPWFILADSTGHQLARTPSITEISTYLKNDCYSGYDEETPCYYRLRMVK